MTLNLRGAKRATLCALLTSLVLPCAAAENDSTFPFSIAISGGASKGAYEAGLNWAVVALGRSITDNPNTPIGLVRSFDAVSFTGASAGGINALLSGLSWCSRPGAEGVPNKIDNNLFRDVWFMPDVNHLLPARADSPLYDINDALLARTDNYAAAKKLNEAWRKPLFRPDCRVPLGVTVTKVVPAELKLENLDVVNQRFYFPFELRVQADRSVRFFFDPRDYASDYDPARILMPRATEAPAYSIDDRAVTEAVLTSSAFPVAFGRMRLQYCQLGVAPSATAGATSPGAPIPDAAGKVCPPGYTLAESEFADGGLFDNLPIGLARTLAEDNIRTRHNPEPVTYIYLDPNRLRYQVPKPVDPRACSGPKPPAACRQMDFSFFSEIAMFGGAFGTARSNELFREITSENWQLNLADLSNRLAERVQQDRPKLDCRTELPYFDQRLDCASALRQAGKLLVIAYAHIDSLITPPYSSERLRAQGIATDCRQTHMAATKRTVTSCKIDTARYHEQIASAMLGIARRAGLIQDVLYQQIGRARVSTQSDRRLWISSRGAPITGTLLSDFGSFLDLKFRVYDYYVGVYDALVTYTASACRLQYSPTEQPREFGVCFDSLGEHLYRRLGVGDDVAGRYVFARLAQWEFGTQERLRFAYTRLPAEDRDMRIIHDGLLATLKERGSETEQETDVVSVETTFFNYLVAQHFVPTPTQDGSESLLAQIMRDPDNWPYEMTRRATNRLVYLEDNAKKIYKAREPDPKLREQAYTGLMGATALVLQTATYKTPSYTWAPSTAPDDWIWRYFIPYQLSYDVAEGDILLTWQPTWSLGANTTIGVPFGLGFAGGLLKSMSTAERGNYTDLGVDFTYAVPTSGWPSLGITPTWYHSWQPPDIGAQDTIGLTVHAGIMKNRFQIGLGVRDVKDASGTWLLTLGVADLPGLTHWLTR